jgi:hypothetical protein
MINLNPTFPSSDANSCLPRQVLPSHYMETESSLLSSQRSHSSFFQPHEHPHIDFKITIPSTHRSSNCTVPFVSLAENKVCIPVLSHHVCSHVTASWKNKFCTFQTQLHQGIMHGDLYTRRNIVYLCSMAEACNIFALENFFHLLTSVQSASCRLNEGLFDVCVAQWVSTCWGWHLPIASCFKPVKNVSNRMSVHNTRGAMTRSNPRQEPCECYLWYTSLAGLQRFTCRCVFMLQDTGRRNG